MIVYLARHFNVLEKCVLDREGGRLTFGKGDQTFTVYTNRCLQVTEKVKFAKTFIPRVGHCIVCE